MKYKYFLIFLIIFVLSVVLYFFNKKDTKDNFNFSDIPRRVQISDELLQQSILRQPGPLTNITITGINQGRSLTISINPEGLISFSEDITLILPNNKNLPIGPNNRTILKRIGYYTEDSKFFVEKTVRYNNQRPVIEKSCYDLNKGPLPKPHIFSFNEVLQRGGYTFTEVYGKEGSSQLSDFDRIFNENIRQLRRNGKNLLSTRKDFFETPFFNFFGKIDRLYKPNGELNERFLGLQNVRVSSYRPLPAPFRIEGVFCTNEYTYKKTMSDGQIVERTIKFKDFEQKPLKLFNPRDYDYGYDNTSASDNMIRMDPVQGIDFNNLRSKFEDIPDLQEFANAYDAATLGDNLPRGKKIGNYRYYPVPEKTSKGSEINGIIRGPSKSTVDFAEQMTKQYNLCKAQLKSIIQPLNQSGNACPDSQDVALSTYSYNPARACDWAKVGDAWCNYEEMAGDKMLICEWGKLYHGTSDRFVKAIMFVFSGTDDSSDFISDASFLPTTVNRINALVHTGFYQEFLKWFPRIMKYLKATEINRLYNTPYKKIIFSGHSLGGAQAQIAAAYFRNLFNMNDVDIEIATQAAPYPFVFPVRPRGYGTIPHSKRLAGYFYDECIFNPTRDDPVVDSLCSAVFGMYCHSTPETPITEYISREWGGNPFTGGWTRCEYDGTDYRNWEPPISLLAFLNDLGADVLTFGLTWLIEKLISAIEHPIAKYYEKSKVLCPNSNDPNDGDKRQIICDMLRAENALNPSQFTQSMIDSLNCPPYSL